VVEAGAEGPVARTGANVIALPPIAALQGAVGRRVVVGIRPEHVTLERRAGSSPLPVALDLVETLGSEALLHTRLGETPFVARAETRGDISHLSGVRALHVPTDLIKVFDGETGRSLTRAAA
jgi:multiple sugar transport system ATP-binding protein